MRFPLFPRARRWRRRRWGSQDQHAEGRAPQRTFLSFLRLKRLVLSLWSAVWSTEGHALHFRTSTGFPEFLSVQGTASMPQIFQSASLSGGVFTSVRSSRFLLRSRLHQLTLASRLQVKCFSFWSSERFSSTWKRSLMLVLQTTC